MDDYSTLCKKAIEIIEVLNRMYSAYNFYWDVDVDTLDITIVAKSPYHYFNFKYPRIESNNSIIRKIQGTLNSVCITYVLGADLNHEKEEINERDNITAD